MKVKKMELNNFKRFTHLIVENIPQTAKLVVLVGPNGSGKTSFMEAMNHYYKYTGYANIGDYKYLSKTANVDELNHSQWLQCASKLVDIDFYDATLPKNIGDSSDIKGHFYFRSAYRNEPDFQINSMQKQQDPTKSIRLESLIQNDQTVSANYQRLIANTISGVFNDDNDSKTVAVLRDELTGKIRTAIERVFDDLKFSSLGEPLKNGNFYFTKGTTKNFSYRNLSAGEKSAFDLILDMVVQAKYYPDAIYCIDEPETHMHTKLQGRVLRELYLLIPGQSQLWLSTHSIGMLQEAEEIEKLLTAFENHAISRLEDIEGVRSEYAEIMNRASLLDDSPKRTEFLERAEARSRENEAVIEDMGDTIALWEEQKRLEEERMKADRESAAAESRQRESQAVNRQEVQNAIDAIYGAEYQSGELTGLVNEAIRKLALVSGYPEEQEYSDKLDAAISYASGLPSEAEWQQARAAEEAARAASEAAEAERTRREQESLAQKYEASTVPAPSIQPATEAPKYGPEGGPGV